MIRVLLLALALLTAPASAQVLGVAPIQNDSGLTQETRRYYGAMTTGTTMTRTRVIDTLVRCMMTAGVWNKTDIFYLHAANAQQTGLLNLKAGGTFTLTAEASITFTANQGFTGNGTDMYLSSTWDFNSSAVFFTQNSAHIAVWIFVNSAAANTFAMGSTPAGGSSARIAPRSTAEVLSIRLNNEVSVVSGTAFADASGDSVGSRRGANDMEIYRNGVSAATDASASVGVPTENFSVLRTGTTFSARQVSISHVGGGLTDTEVTDYYNCKNAYMGAL